MPKVSIIIAAYNAARFLPETLQSCLVQTHSDIEIVVVDDGSTDDTRAVIAQFPAVRYHYQTNSGPATARNTGWAHATGEFLQFLDADDLLMPTKLERSLAVFAQYPETAVVYSAFQYCSVDDSRRWNPQPIVSPPPEGAIYPILLAQTSAVFPIHTPLVRRAAAERTRKFDPAIKGVEDWYFWIELASTGAIFRHIPEALAIYRQVSTSISRNELQMATARLIAAQHLRQLPLPADFPLEERIAGRHHMVALKLWAAGRRMEARQHFHHALQLTPHSRLPRILLWALSFITTASQGERIVEAGVALRGRLKTGRLKQSSESQ